MSATTRPARRIVRTWSGVLYSMRARPNTSGLRVALGPVELRLQGLHDPVGDLVQATHAVHADEQTPRVIGLGQGGGLLGVDLQTPADDRLGVVAAPLLLGALEQPADDLLGVGVDLDDGVQTGSRAGKDVVQFGDLLRGARVPVEQEAGGGVGLFKSVPHYVVGELVGHVYAGLLVGVGLLTEIGLLGDVRAEDVPGGDRRDAEPLADTGGLRALAGPGRAEEDQTCAHRR